VRWEGQALRGSDPGALPGLGQLDGLVRSVHTPEFAGVTFHEVRCRSALNRVPGSSPVPFRWTINPYRGCTHGCVYCFARNTHTYLDLDAGRDFDSQIVVKTNVAEVLRRELASTRWTGEHVAMGTNTDPYQRAEGRYRLMPGIIEALAGSGTPFSILTKGTLLSRDLPLLTDAARHGSVGVSLSLALLEPDLQAVLEPGTPTPRARLDLIRRVRAAGLPCGVLLAPILPDLTDGEDQLGHLVEAVAAAGATRISAMALHLRPGAREWFFSWLRRTHPGLVPAYERYYARGANAPKAYRQELADRVAALLREAPLERPPRATRPDPHTARWSPQAREVPAPTSATAEQAALF